MMFQVKIDHSKTIEQLIVTVSVRFPDQEWKTFEFSLPADADLKDSLADCKQTAADLLRLAADSVDRS